MRTFRRRSHCIMVDSEMYSHLFKIFSEGIADDKRRIFKGN
jgi:hypothetical protein